MSGIPQFRSALIPTLCLLVALGLSQTLLAEHRVALLISNSDYKNQEKDSLEDIREVRNQLVQIGFRCQIIENVANEYGFRDALESFAAKTPTRSTVLVYYQGRLIDENLLAVDSRGKYPIKKILEGLSTKGASRHNFIHINAGNKSKYDGEIPLDCGLSFASSSQLFKLLEEIGPASTTISPPDKFIAGKNAGDEWVNSMGVIFCWCPPGKYIAGSPDEVTGRYDDEEQREVIIKHGFWLSKYELARGQEVSKRGPGNRTIARNKLDPMTMINHDDAKSMTRNFTTSEQKAGRLPSDWQYSLPTEDQWEYAARAGTTSRFYFGDDINQLPLHANFADKSFYDSGDIFSNSAHRTLNDGAIKLARIGSYQPNPWGFHDMYGNVAEWCINLAIRGGSWVSVPENCRSAYRDSFSSRNEQNFIGYRLVIQKRPSDKQK